MLTLRHALMALTAFVLAGCQPPAVIAEDPYKGLLPTGQTVTQAPTTFPIDAKGKSVAVVLSPSTEKQLEYLGKLVESIKNNPMLVYRSDYEEVTKPQLIITSVVNKLKERFGRVDTIEDFRAVGPGKFDNVAVIDLSVVMPKPFNNFYAYTLKVDVLNPQLQRIGRLEGYGREGYYCIPIDCALAAQYRAMKQSVEQFNTAADANLR